MGIVQAVAEALQRALGESLDRLGRDCGAIRRQRKFSGSRLVQALVLTLLRRPRARPEHYAATAALPGVEVTPRAVAKRFTPALVELLRGALDLLLAEVVAAPPAVAPTLAKFAGVYLGDSTTIPLPEAYAGRFPACGGAAGRGRAALKLQVVWDLVTGRIARLAPGPGRSSDSADAAASVPPPPGSLAVFDLGYFDLDRLRRWAAAGVSFLSRLQPGTSVFDRDGTPIDLAAALATAGPGPLDRPILLGAGERLPCRLVASAAPPEVAARRRQRAYERARDRGRVPSAAHLAACGWTAFVTDRPAESLSWKEVVVLYRARWQVELPFKLWKSHGRLGAPPAGAATPERAMAEVWAKLIAAVVRHWVLLMAAWPDARRSLSKAAGVIRDRVVLLIAGFGTPARMVEALGQIGAGLGAVARITPRKRHPSAFQLLADPGLLNWGP
jgi:hypothetical protein